MKTSMVRTRDGLERHVSFLPAEVVPAPHLCLFLDAEYYLGDIGAPAMLARLVRDGALPPMDCVFVSNHSNVARHRDYVWNPTYAAFIVEDVLAWAREARAGALPESLILCGLSLSGLSAAGIALSYPGLFSGVICQSGSFWWNAEWLAGQIPRARGLPGRFWISVGRGEVEAGITHEPSGMRQDVSQLDACTRFAERLRGAPASVRFEVFDGGHAVEPWKAELPDALAWVSAAGPTADAPGGDA